ncbi:MAG: prolipoprotein diacylglyceryl transferase family protein [Bacteroidota bacterium]
MPSITIEQSHNLHEVFYVGSYLIMFAFLIYTAVKRKYPLYPFLLILLCMSLFAMIGGKLLSYSISEWKQIIHDLKFPYTDKKRLFGYFLFGFLGLVISRKALKYNKEIYDILAYAWPIRLIVARMGCLFGGCCYGIPTQSDWGIRYANSFPAFQDQLHSGLVTYDSSHSLFVHPTQVYEMVLGMIILLLISLVRQKRYFKNNLSLLILSVAVYGAFRFFIEFLRIRGDIIHGLNNTQWGILILIAISTILILITENRETWHSRKSFYAEQARSAKLFLSLGIMILILLVLQWMSPFELIICSLILVFLVTGIIFQIIRLKSSPQHVRISAVLILISILLMGQKAEVASDTLQVIKNHISIGFGGMFGREEKMCGGYDEYQAIGAEIGYSFTDQKNYNHFIATEFYRMNFDNEANFGISPYYEFRGRNLGLGAGINYSPYYSSLKGADFLPRVNLRIGSQDKFFIDGRFSNHLPSGLPHFQAGIGFRVGPNTPFQNKNILRIGISEAGFYLNPRLNIENQIIFEPFFAFGSSENYQLGVRFFVLID